MGPVIDKVLGLRCTSFGYQYSEIVGSLSSVYFCGGDCVEEQWLRMGKAAKVLHGRKHGVPAADSIILNFYKFLMDRIDAKASD